MSGLLKITEIRLDKDVLHSILKSIESIGSESLKRCFGTSMFNDSDPIDPLKLKPILSHKYIEVWANAAKLVHGAKKVVVIGYSFNSADEHFNDIIRNSQNRNYDIVAPDVLSEAFMKRITKIFGVSQDNFSNTKVQGFPSKTTSNIRLIQALADQVNVGSLFSE